jgi:hypothetical protein
MYVYRNERSNHAEILQRYFPQRPGNIEVVVRIHTLFMVAELFTRTRPEVANSISWSLTCSILILALQIFDSEDP